MASECRLIISGPCPPAFNMACDEALALLTPVPVLRFYQWDPPALSLGHFQTKEEVAPFAETLGNPPMVKRMTGGGAIYHFRELTYSVIAPAGKIALPEKTSESYRFLHQPFIRVFRTLGIEASDNDPVRPDRKTVCFDSITSYDVVASGKKVLGSAQRRTKNFFLQHGSIPLMPNPFSEHATSVFEETGREYSADDLIPLLADAVSSSLDISFSGSGLTGEENEIAASLESAYLVS